MDFKQLIKKKGFWVALAAAIVLILQAFGLKADAPLVNEVISGAMGVLVALGLMTTAEKKQVDNELSKTESKDADESKGTESENDSDKDKDN